MASSVGGIIEADDYNSIRNKVIAVLGNGIGPTGYGQTARLNSSAVSAGAAVTALQWQNLRWDIYNTLIHQNGTVPSIVSVSTGDTVRFGAGHPNNAYDTLADIITTNRFNAAQYLEDSFGSNSSAAAWTAQKYIDITYTFSTADAARYFFNSGGKIRITSSRPSSGGDTAQMLSWSSLLTSAGTQSFGGQTPAAGFSPMNGTNFYRLTNSFQTYHESIASGNYTANAYRLQAASNVADNSTGSANIVYIRVLFTDGYVDPGPATPENPPPGDLVSGTFIVASDALRPTSVMQVPPGVATFTVSSPSSNLSSASFIYS
jgi:hypothetical protein